MNLLGAGELVHTMGMKEEMSSVTPPETSAMLQFEKEIEICCNSNILELRLIKGDILPLLDLELCIA